MLHKPVKPFRQTLTELCQCSFILAVNVAKCEVPAFTKFPLSWISKCSIMHPSMPGQDPSICAHYCKFLQTFFRLQTVLDRKVPRHPPACNASAFRICFGCHILEETRNTESHMDEFLAATGSLLQYTLHHASMPFDVALCKFKMIEAEFGSHASQQQTLLQMIIMSSTHHGQEGSSLAFAAG